MKLESQFKFQCYEIDICEMHHIDIIKDMVHDKYLDLFRKEEIINDLITKIKVIFQPYEKEYIVEVQEAQIIVKRKKDNQKLCNICF